MLTPGPGTDDGSESAPLTLGSAIKDDCPDRQLMTLGPGNDDGPAMPMLTLGPVTDDGSEKPLLMLELYNDDAYEKPASEDEGLED